MVYRGVVPNTAHRSGPQNNTKAKQHPKKKPLLMDQHYSRRSVLAREIAGSQALGWLLLIMGFFAIGESRSSDIECLRSIKESLQDPLQKLSNWVFNNSSEGDNFICSFNGVECWFDSSPDALVLNMRLSGMGLRGEFPQGIAKCKALTGLDLSNNHLYGSIPSDISRLLTFVTSLDLSYNTFSGKIPPNIANCSYLNVLKLNNNLLTGPIPALLASSKRLRSFTVANNLLSGPVPRFFNPSFPPESYANNTGLCDDPLDPCKPGKFRSLFAGGFYAGWGISFTLFLVVRLFTPFWEYMNKLMKRKLMATPRLQSLPSSQRMHNTMISRLEKFATRMSFRELKQATDNFSENNVIAIGEMEITYKAVLSNGWCVAIKRLCCAPHINHVFLFEIMTLGRLRHRNLVPVFGFCQESNDRFLIYKFMPKGSLHDCLFSSEGGAKIMEWPVRVKIAVGIAKGIAWLHLKGVVHRGISSKCILLDEDFNPRISDFGKATTLNHNNSSWEPSFNKEILVLGSYEEDVHSFGKLLLELITGTKYNEIISSFDIDADMFEQISHSLNEAGPPGVCVQSMMEQGFGDEISRFLRVAAKCLECDPCNWPSMEEVYQMLIGKTRDDAMDGSDTSVKNEIEFADIQNN